MLVNDRRIPLMDDFGLEYFNTFIVGTIIIAKLSYIQDVGSEV